MSKDKYCIEPLSKKLIDYLAKNNKLFETDINELPNDLKNKIDESKKEQNDIFVKNAFIDLEIFYNKLPYSKKEFNFNKDDKIYFMYKLRAKPDLLVNIGYTKYSFSLTINDDTGDLYGGDSLYTLSITNTETGKTGVYETTVGRFD